MGEWWHAICPRGMGMKVEQWMKRRVVTVRPRDSVRHARELMEKDRINQLPVVVDGRLVGIITDRDVRDAFPSVFASMEAPLRGRQGEPNPDAITVEEVMTPNVLTLAPGASIVEVARLMKRERVGAVPIVESDRLVGIIARSDLLEALIALAESR